VKKLSEYGEILMNGRLPVMRGLVRSPDDQIRNVVIHEIMCNARLDFAPIEERFGIRFREYFAEDLRRLTAPENEALVAVGPESLEATPVASSSCATSPSASIAGGARSTRNRRDRSSAARCETPRGGPAEDRRCSGS